MMSRLGLLGKGVEIFRRGACYALSMQSEVDLFAMAD
jgi:hypothetical protein